MRTPEEILARIAEVEAQDDDLFGTERYDLIQALPFDRARPWLKADATAAEWPQSTEESVRLEAIAYLTFAYGKASGHRGLSASRSLSHYRAWLWLLGILPEDWDDLPYAMYGVPALFAAARALGQELPTDEDLVRMSQGKRCEPDCYSGCGT